MFISFASQDGEGFEVDPISALVPAASVFCVSGLLVLQHYVLIASIDTVFARHAVLLERQSEEPKPVYYIVVMASLVAPCYDTVHQVKKQAAEKKEPALDLLRFALITKVKMLQ